MESSLQHLDRHQWWLYFLQGVIGIGFGLLVVIWPKETLIILIGLTGMFLLLGGVLGLIIAFAGSMNHLSWGWTLAGSLVSILAGTVLVKWPAPTLLIFLIILGIWAVAAGTLSMASALELHMEIPYAWLLALAGLCSLLFGVVLLFIPAIGLRMLIYLTGVFVIVYGIISINTAFRVRNWRKSVADAECIMDVGA
jgi:hypothetical protein